MRETRLPSGALLVTDERRGTKSFSFSIWFPVGSMHEAPRARGFVHFIEHMVFKGTARRDGPSLWRIFERTGGYINAFTERDCMCVHATVPAEFREEAVFGLCDAVFGSTFPQAEFRKEKEVVLSEIAQLEDAFEERSWDAFLERFRLAEAVGRPIAGKKSEVARISRFSLFSAYRRLCDPRRALIIATGPEFSAEFADIADAAISEARAAAGINAAGSDALMPASSIDASSLFEDFFDETRVPGPARSFSSLISAPCEQAYVVEGFQLGSPLDDRERAAITVISSILGEASTSRLFMEIRERLALAYSISSSVSFLRNDALLSIHGAVEPERLSEYLRATDRVLAELLDSGPQEEELAEAHGRLAGSLELSLEDPEARARWIASWMFYKGSIPDEVEEAQLYRSIGPDDCKAILERLARAPRGRLILGPVRAKVRARKEILP